jgi:RNA polymerase sigma-70 factor (ECF subfamily)
MTGAKHRETRDERVAAFEKVLSHYEVRLIRYVARIVNGEDAAQDVVQDTFIRFFKGWKDEMEPGPAVSSWLYRVAHNCAVDYIRKQSRRVELHKRHACEQPDFVEPDRGKGFRVGEHAARAVAALNALSEREQQLVVLKVYEEKSYKEISEITGLTTSNVGYILHHAMKKMAAWLKENGL